MFDACFFILRTYKTIAKIMFYKTHPSSKAAHLNAVVIY